MSSQWSYLGHDVFMDIAKRYDLEVVFKPILLKRLFSTIGAVPLIKRDPVRLRYRLVELQRWRDFRGLPLIIEPKYWPFDPTLVDTFIIAALRAGYDIDAFLHRTFAGIWVEQLDLTDPAVIASIASSTGLPTKLLEPNERVSANIEYDTNFEMALDKGIFGAPSYVLNGENFWGQDRLELLEHALALNRIAIEATGS
jgi:2-hydroxychromene-2-carboxylate isomerase